MLCVRRLSFALAFLLARSAFAQQTVPVPLRVDAGTPLRLYITQRVWYRLNAVVQAKLVEPVWAFDRVVIPAGTIVQGRVVKLDPVPKMIRLRAIVGGDFTPLKRAQVSFTNVTLPDGRALPLQTENALGLATIYVPPRARKFNKKPNAKAASTNQVRNQATQLLKQQAQAQINARTLGLYDFVRGPNKREWIENFVFSKLPYHPQWYRSGTRFDAVLDAPLDFGSVDVGSGELAGVGTQPPPDSIARMRILTTISSGDAHLGDSMEGMLSQPLFTADHKLVLPQGSRLRGKITLVQSARSFHRGGKLRFTIEEMQAPTSALASSVTPEGLHERVQPAQAQLAAVEADPNAVKVDQEGTAQATESKTRLLRPAIAALVAAKSMDNDEGKQTATGTGDPNTSGRALGGFSGFGLFGIAASYGPRAVGSALGFYGLAWSVYTNVVSKGREVTFQRNTDMAIRFGTPPRVPK